jgi:hypothetical protein
MIKTVIPMLTLPEPRGAEGEGGHDRQPVEGLAPRRVDGVDGQSALGRVPEREHRREHNGKEAGRHDVRDPKLDVEHVGRHGAEDGNHDHGQPVDPRSVSRRSELQHESDTSPTAPSPTAMTGSS